MKLIDPNVAFHEGDHQGGLVIQHAQEITSEYLDELKAERAESGSKPTGNFHRFASIPTAVYEKWLREGYDARKEPARKTLLKLHTEGLDAFITTNKVL
jgi:hypothetical protein